MKNLHDKITEFRTLFTEIVDEVEEIVQVNINTKKLTEYRIYKMEGFVKISTLATVRENDLIQSVKFYLGLGYNILIEKL